MLISLLKTLREKLIIKNKIKNKIKLFIWLLSNNLKTKKLNIKKIINEVKYDR